MPLSSSARGAGLRQSQRESGLDPEETILLWPRGGQDRTGTSPHIPLRLMKPDLNSLCPRQDSQSCLTLQTAGILQGSAWSSSSPSVSQSHSIGSICNGPPVSREARGAASGTATRADSKLSRVLDLPRRFCLLFLVEQRARCSLRDHGESEVGLCQVHGSPGAPGPESPRCSDPARR